MFDTHCHLNFKAFDETVSDVIAQAKGVGVNYITIPGTDIPTSQKAISIAEKHDGVFAAIGIHPHHVYELLTSSSWSGDKTAAIESQLDTITSLLQNDKGGKVVAIGEIGLDRHMYQKTKYGEYIVNEDFITLQKEFFAAQIELAKKHKKSVIIHNREAKKDLLPLLYEHWDSFFEGRMVLHCGEPDQDLLDFVIEKKIYWGVDGDVTYYKEKADFIPRVPLNQLVLETDAPFLLPEPLKSEKKYPNNPSSLTIIADYLARIRNEDVDTLKKQTEENGLTLFKLRS